MEIININIKDLKPYDKNAKKHPKKQVKFIANSIEHFGMLDPIGVWGEDNLIVEGHGRLEACKSLGYTEVPCIRLDHLSDEERKAYTLAHNKVAESEWDFDLLGEEINEIFTLDMEELGFEFLTEEEHQKNKNKPLEIQKRFNILEFDENRCEGVYQMPTIEAVDYVPKRLVGFNYAKSSKEFDFGIHFYLDDYQFERVWNEPNKYIDLLSKFDCVLTPHYSVYSDMALPIRVYNTFRGKLLGQMMQDRGLTVIPTVYWGDESTYDYSFDGLPKNGTLSVYTMNYNKNPIAKEIKEKGLVELLKRKTPKNLLVYGNGIKFENIDFGDTKVFYYTNEVIKRMHER